MIKRPWLLVAVALVAASAVVVLALSSLTGPPAGAGSVPLGHHESGPFQFEAPTHWQVHDASTMFSGGFAQAVVGTVPVPMRCRLALVHIDINCYFEERLRPGDVSIVLGGGIAFRDPEAVDRMRAEAPRSLIDGRVTYQVDHEVSPESYYREDRSATWYIERPGTQDNFYTVDAKVRGPEAERLWVLVKAFVASLEFADEEES